MNKALIFALLISMLPIQAFAERKGVDPDGKWICRLVRHVHYVPEQEGYFREYWVLTYLLYLENRETLQKLVKHSTKKTADSKEEAKRYDIITYYKFKKQSEYYLQRGTCAWEEYNESWLSVSKIIDNDPEMSNRRYAK